MKLLNVALVSGSLVGSMVAFCPQAFAAAEMTSQEISCRAKAKEVAAETYRGCVSEYKNAEVERLRKNYQKKLKALKDNYEREIDTLTGEATKPASKSKKTLSAKRSEAVEVKESNPAPALSDESTMDLPEPVPVEN